MKTSPQKYRFGMLTSIFTSTLVGSWWISHLFGLFGKNELANTLKCDLDDEDGFDIAENVGNLMEQGITCLDFCSCYEIMYENQNQCQCSNEPPPPYVWYITNLQAHLTCKEPNYNVTYINDPLLQGCTSGTFLNDRIPLLSTLSSSKLKSVSKKQNQALELMDLLSLA